MGRVAWGVARTAVVVVLAGGCVTNPGSSSSAPTTGTGPPSPATSTPSIAPAASPGTSASGSPSPKPTTSASVPSTSPAWHRLGTIQDDYVHDVVAFAHGYVATSSSMRSVWYSEDGTSWQAITLPFTAAKDPYGRTLDAHVSALATNGQQVLAVGGYSHAPCVSPPSEPTTGGGPECPLAPTAWISDDGRTWRSANPGPALPDAAYDQGGEFIAAWPVSTGGWDAAVCYWTGEFCGGRDVMHSSDGLIWTALARPPALVGVRSDDRPWFHAGVTGPSGRRLVFQVWTEWDTASGDDQSGYSRSRPVTTLSLSTDGHSWAPVLTFAGANAAVVVGVGAGGGLPWVLGGWSGPIGGWEGESVPTVWVSADASSWRLTRLPTTSCAQSVDSIIRTSTGYIAVGACNNPNEATHETWVSRDAVTWTRLARSADPGSDFGPQHVADGPAGVIGVGAWLRSDGNYETAIWQLR